jgi:hypothetical protein
VRIVTNRRLAQASRRPSRVNRPGQLTWRCLSPQ